MGQAKRSGLWDQLERAAFLVRHHINIAAFEDPQRDLYIKAIEASERRDAYFYSGHSEPVGLRKLRLPIYLNDAQAVADLVGGGPAAHMGQAGAVLRTIWCWSRNGWRAARPSSGKRC